MTRASRTFQQAEFREVPRDAHGRWTNWGGASNMNRVLDDRSRGPRSMIEKPPGRNTNLPKPKQVKRRKRQFWKPKPQLIGPAQAGEVRR